MRIVTSTEEKLLRILYGFFGHRPGDLRDLILKTEKRPKCLSRECVDLAEAALAKGCTNFVAQEGCAAERFWVKDVTVEGRIWERYSNDDLKLEFSPASLDFLIWLTTESGLNMDNDWHPPCPLKSGDLLLLFVAYQRTRDSNLNPLWWRGQPVLENHPIIRLLYPDEFADAPKLKPAAFERILRPPLVSVVEVLLPRLSNLWVGIERSKRNISSITRIRRVSNSQSHVLSLFLKSIVKAERRDLSRWMLSTGQRVFKSQVSRQDWLEGLDVNSRSFPIALSEREELYQQILCFPSHFRTLGKWHREALQTRFIDEGYDESQFWKSIWERYNGDDSLAVAEEVMKENEFFQTDETTATDT